MYSSGGTLDSIYRGQREKLSEPELKRKILESWQENIVIDVRKCISAWEKKTKISVNRVVVQSIIYSKSGNVIMLLIFDIHFFDICCYFCKLREKYKRFFFFYLSRQHSKVLDRWWAIEEERGKYGKVEVKC